MFLVGMDVRGVPSHEVVSRVVRHQPRLLDNLVPAGAERQLHLRRVRGDVPIRGQEIPEDIDLEIGEIIKGKSEAQGDLKIGRLITSDKTLSDLLEGHTASFSGIFSSVPLDRPQLDLN